MEIRVLRYFLMVAKEESITKAANRLHLTQPTLSRQLSQMEEEVGVKLLERGARKITLTPEGILLRRRAEEILQLVDKTEQELLEQEMQVQGKITVGCGEAASMEVLAELIRAFREKYPLVQFDMFTATADLVKERMDQGWIDIGLLLEPIDMEKYDFIRLDAVERWAVLMCPTDPLAAKDAITAKDLLSKPLILPQRPNVQSELMNWFGMDYEKLNIAFTSNLTMNSAVLVSHGLAYAMTMEGPVSFWDSKKIVYKPLSPALTTTGVLAWKRSQPFSIATVKFIEHIKCFLGMDQA